MANDFTCDVVGLDAFGAALDALLPKIVQAGFEVLKPDVEEHILAPAKELTPVLTGALRDSGEVSDPIEIGEQVALSIGFGGDNGEISYALDQHENEQYEHREGKTDKFLERPVMDWTKDGPERVARAIAGRVKP